MAFKVGHIYSRPRISEELGGQIRDYLPQKDGRVVCGCFRVEAGYNPGAPTEVTYGEGPRVQKSAEMVARQTEPVPVFLYRAQGAWEYVGLYRCRGRSTDPEVLRRKMRQNPARGPITGVLYFESASSYLQLPEEIPNGSNYNEGGVQQILVNRYERDARARDECTRHYGTACVLCGFDFGSVYGEVMADFIHVHHLIPLSSVGREYELDPIRDLRPVCPNCHAALHRREPPYSLDEVRQLLQRREE